MKKLKSWLSIQYSKNPGRLILLTILFLNVAFIFLSAAMISALSLSGTEKMNFWEAAYYTVTMILDAGCISEVVEDVGTSGVMLVFVCLAVIVIGMVMFTGAVIGYLTNYISNLIEHANSGSRRLNVYDHTVILNWNTRASEIVNDLMFCETPQTVVILVSDRKEEIERELHERMSDTVQAENREIVASAKDMKPIKRWLYIRKHRFQNRVTFIVREGDTFSTKQLNDISIKKAKSILILGSDINNTVCKFDYVERVKNFERGNPLSIKTLIQVAELTGAEDSADNQQIVIEIDNEWTSEVVKKIIKNKEVQGKCNIIPVHVSSILGCILSQFSLMPELNMAYKELFSNRGATFYAEQDSSSDELLFLSDYLKTHTRALPLALMKRDDKMIGYYSAGSEKDVKRVAAINESDYTVKLNRNYWLEQRNVIILGHNSKIRDIMLGFTHFREEWNFQGGNQDILRIVVIDDKKNLEKMDYYRDYPYVEKVVEADIFEKDVICEAIEEFVDSTELDTSVLILSDDMVLNDEIDSGAITNLIYVQDIINKKLAIDPNYDIGKIDVVVEILNPKHHDVITGYSDNNVVISNRYISKMLTQLSENSLLYDFYNDILSYDSADAAVYESKEVYIKKVSRFFDETPAPCKASELVRAIFNASNDESLPVEKRNPTIMLGYVSGKKVVLFEGDQEKIEVALSPKDKLILFSAH